MTARELRDADIDLDGSPNDVAAEVVRRVTARRWPTATIDYEAPADAAAGLESGDPWDTSGHGGTDRASGYAEEPPF